MHVCVSFGGKEEKDGVGEVSVGAGGSGGAAENSPRPCLDLLGPSPDMF